MSHNVEIPIVERLFALQSSPPLDRVRDTELPHIAQAARARSYAPGEIIAPAGFPLRHLFVSVTGSLQLGEAAVPPVFGEVSLLFGTDLDEPLSAGPSGATCLLISRAHFFTIINECPSVLLGFLSTEAVL